jgi:peptide/nickel transport system permease protein
MRRFWKSRAGVSGFILLALLVITGLFGPLIVPYKEAYGRWRDISYWQDNPPGAPPIWVSWLPGGKNSIRSEKLEALQVEVKISESGADKSVWRFDLRGKIPAGYRIDMILSIPGRGFVPIIVSKIGDGGVEAEILRKLAEASEGRPARIPLKVADASGILVAAYQLPEQKAHASPTLKIIGSVSGLLGTDAAKRDIFTGVVLGVRWALLLGVAVSFLTVMTGILLGIGAACFGGWVDIILTRIYEFFSLMPMLPFLIVLSAVYKPSLWSFAALALLFFWTRAFKPVYSMALRIREEEYIEAAKSMGTNRFYRAFRYVLPELLPYGFSIMALSVPGIILYEASVSILGLGDSSVVTWGQMLRDALSQGAVINRMWWWVLPPGLMISITGITFSLIGRGLEQMREPLQRNNKPGDKPEVPSKLKRSPRQRG